MLIIRIAKQVTSRTSWLAFYFLEIPTNSLWLGSGVPWRHPCPSSHNTLNTLNCNFDFTTCEYINHQTGLGYRPITDGSMGNRPIHPLTFHQVAVSILLRRATVATCVGTLVFLTLIQTVQSKSSYLWERSRGDIPYFFENQPIILIKQNLLHANI